MKKRLLAMLLALMLVVGLLPVGVLADDTGGTREITSYVTPSYNSNEGSPGLGELKTIHVVVRSSDDGSVLQEDNWNNVWSTNNIITVNLTSEASSIYDIESASIDRGTNTGWSYGNKQIQFRWTYSMYNDEIATLTIYLCPEYEAPDFPKGEIDTGATIEYIAYEPALLKLLYVNGVTGVDEHTEINGVEFNFVQNYTGDDFSFTPVGTGANNLMYYTAVLSDVADRGNPRNIRSIDISYTLGDGTVETLRVYSGDLRYIKIDADTYEIEANNDDTSIVAFYNQPGAQYSTWSLYDVKFVNTGDALGDENMPETPTYPATEYDFTNWDKNVGGGSPFLPNEEIDDDTVVYAMKTSSSIGGTEFHVMNTNNVLLDRIVEKYNAENNTEYGISDIVLDSVRIQVNGADNESTNPNYFSNRWESPGNPYYHVNNGGIVGSHEIYSNTHIPHEEVRSITVFATTTDGKNIEVNIPRSNNCGDVSISLVQDNIVEIIINAPPEKPSDDDLDVDPDVPGDTGLLTNAVTVTCTNTDAEHNAKPFDLLPGSFSIGDVVYTTEGYTCTVTVNAGAYVTAYSNSTENGTHALAEDESSTKTIKLVYHGNSWTVPEGATPVNFNVTCDTGDPEEPTVPEKPGDGDLEKLSVKLDCVNTDVEHEDGVSTLNLSNSSVGNVVNTDGVYTCVVTPDYASILASYYEDVKVTHNYVDNTAPVFTLTWDVGWKAEITTITREVMCETEEPEQPNVYDIYVTVHNGTATFYGSKVTSSIRAAEGEDITITFTPDEGYTLDYATIDDGTLLIPDGGVYTLKQVDSDHTIEVFYAKDENGGGEDGDEPDGTPDYRQVFVKYVAGDKNGFVTPSHDTFDLDVDENGKVMTDVALALSGTATANTDASFGYWTIEGSGYDGGTYSFEADLENENFSGYLPGETYTFTAYFNGPVVKPEQPNVYDIYVTVHNGTATFYGSKVTSSIRAAEGEDITITFTPDEGYTLDYATIDDGMLLIPDGGVYTLKLVDSDHTIEVFYESDKIGTEDPNEGDGVPDKYQATVNFVAGENGEVTGDVTKVYTIFGADGKYAEEGVITPSLEGVTVTPNEGYKVDGWTNAADERVDPESEITVEGGEVVVFTVNFQSDPSLKEITSFEKKLVTDRKTYHSFRLRVPTFIRNGSTVVVDEGKGVTLLYKITVKGTPGTEFTVRDDSADFAQTGEIPDSGETSFYVAKTFTWREIRRADELTNTAAVLLDGKVADSDTETVDVDIDWDYNPPVVDDDDDDDEDDEVFVPNWLNTTDHYAYIVGYEDGEVKPNNNITRAEVATIFFRLLTDDARAYYWSTDSGFSDVKPGDWYNNAVSTMVNAGILNGYSDGTFQPNANITRAEFATIAARFLSNSYSLNDRFYDTEGHWAEPYINRAAEVGWINGYSDGSFKPDRAITRAEAVTLVNAVLGREPHEDHLLSNMIRWPDNPKSAWYYEAIQEATNSHDYDWASNHAYEIWTELLENRQWSKLEKEWSDAYSAPGGNVMG